MDPFAWAQQKVTSLWSGMPLPGNSSGATTLGTILGKDQKIGDQSNSGFSSWLNTAESIVTYPYNVAHTAYDEVKDKASAGVSFVKDAQTAAISAATGFKEWTKWVVVGLIAVAVIYVVALIPRRP